MTTKSQVVGHAKDLCGLMRPRFVPGQLLRDDDLRQGVDYTRDLNRLLFRGLLGCGVACGLEVTATFDCDVLTIDIGEGLALDCKGDPVHVCAKKSIAVDPRCSSIALTSPLWVVIRGTEKCCAPRAAAACDDEDGASANQCTREVDGFEIRVLTALTGCECGCPDGSNTWHQSDCQCADPAAACYQAHYKGECSCTCGDSGSCDCDWIILARVVSDKAGKVWTAEHQYRRFIRPVLIADPRTKPSKGVDTKATELEKLYVKLEQQQTEAMTKVDAALRKADEQIEEARWRAEAAERQAQEATERAIDAIKRIEELTAQLKKDGKGKGSG